LRVLFHLGGGWALKTYPAAYMRVVIGALNSLGAAVTVLGRPDLQEAGARSEVSEDSATLRRLVEAHHVFVGVDSFPHHFARLVMGWPTVGLFGNTKPCNSDASYGQGYRSSDLNLSCNRCGAYDVCPVFGRKDCANYAPPERVVADILDLAREVYGREA
jgi:ADP-heptose:LPS heptosyltransferase